MYEGQTGTFSLFFYLHATDQNTKMQHPLTSTRKTALLLTSCQTSHYSSLTFTDINYTKLISDY